MATLNDRILILPEHTEDKIDTIYKQFLHIINQPQELDGEPQITPLVKGKPLY